MPLSFEDANAPDITGDPAPERPLTQKQMQGAQKAAVNQKRLPTQNGERGRRSVNGQPDQEAEQKPEEQDQQTSQAGEQSGMGEKQQQSAQPTTGVGPAFQALHDGIGQILNDPEWIKHPLLHLFSDPTSDPKQYGQDLWAATQWWGRVVNAAIDPEAMHAAAASIENDNSIQGRVAQQILQIHKDPIHDFAWNAMPYVYQMGAEWEPWMWAPAVAAAGPQQLNQLPQAMLGLFGNDLRHPQFADPDWYARMGAYLISAGILAKTGGKGAGPLLKFSGRLKIFEPLTELADRYLGGPGKKTPVKGPDGQTYDPDADPTGHAFASWLNQHLPEVGAASSVIGQAAEKPADQLIAHPEIDNAYQKVAADPTAKTDFAKVLGFNAAASAEELKNHFFAMVENRELSPRMSSEVVKNWKRFGPVIDQKGKLHYWHSGEAPYRPVLPALERITDPKRAKAAQRAMRAVNGFRADLRTGVHGYGNDLAESLVKGILNHGRKSDYYSRRLVSAIREVLPTAAERERVSKAIEDVRPLNADRRAQLERMYRNPGAGIAASNRALEELNRLDEEEAASGVRTFYDTLEPHEQWAVDLYRRLTGEIRWEKMQSGRQLEAQPNFFYRVPKRIQNLEAILKGIPDQIKAEARGARGRTPFGYVSKQHRAFQLVASPEGEIRAEPAYATTEAANAQRAAWREAIKADLIQRAAKNPALQAIVSDPRKLEALAYAEIPDFSRDILDSMLGEGDRGMMPDLKALYTHQVMEMAKRTLVKHERDGQFHPLAVARSETGQESSPTLSEHFKHLHGNDTTTDFYKGEGWKGIDGFGSGHVFHPAFADPLNASLRAGRGDADAAMRFFLGLAKGGKHLIMLNPAWHSVNMIGRFAWLTGMHPLRVANAILKARGLKELNPQQAQEWWDRQEYEAMDHGLLPPQLNEDVVNDAGRYHSLATGDTEMGLPIDGRVPVRGLDRVPGLADAVNAVKGVDHSWQTHVNGRMWKQIHNLGVLSYVVFKDEAVHRGMPPGDARLMAASMANSIAGMVSPDRWMNSPAMYQLSQLALFAPNWWRTFPRIITNSYDRMGMKTTPALSNAWAFNTAKTIGTMILLKGATDNLLNWLMSGHWQFQNPQGYQNQITMDRFGGVDPKTGAHLVMEDPFERQVTDLERALGIEEAMKEGHWKPEFAEEGTAEVALARMSPLLQALDTASNFDLYSTIKQRALRWVDPTHPNTLGSPGAAIAGLLNLTPMGYAAQTALQGATAQPGTLDWGPFKGTRVPGSMMRAFDPNNPLSPLLSLLGVRGGYPAPVRTEGRGLSSDEATSLAQLNNDWNTKLQEQQHAVQSGGETFYDFAYWYRQNSSYHAGEMHGLTNGTSDYMNGADGLLARYEAVFNDKQATDANGDINWHYVTQQQDQLQAQTDPATWRQMIALKNQREMQFPVLRAYKDSLQNYHNYQDFWAHQHGTDGETLRAMIAQGASAPNYKQFEASHHLLTEFYNDKRRWELDTKQGFAYGLFTDNSYVMRVVAPSGTKQQAEQAEEKILPQIEQMEQAGQFVTPSGQ